MWMRERPAPALDDQAWLAAAFPVGHHRVRIAVAALQPVVQEIFDIARFKHVMEVFPSVRSALHDLSAPALSAYDAAQ